MRGWRVKSNTTDHDFFESQGYKSKQNILYQDDKITILLQENGKKIANKRTRYLNIRYFFLTDQVEKVNLAIKYCPTEAMTTEFMTKPLHGKKIQQFRNDILNVKWGEYRVHDIYIYIIYYMNTC